MRVYDQIRQAIIDKDIVIATYHKKRREMCPHVIGKKDGREQCLFYQFGGESNSGLGRDGDPNNWRCIPIDGLSNVQIIKGEWHTAGNHTRPQTCVDQIDEEVRV